MVSTWIEMPAKGRHGGPVRAGMWSAVVIGSHPIEAGQEVWLEFETDELNVVALPAYWIENKGVNSLWHVPLPPQDVGSRLHYRACARLKGESTTAYGASTTAYSPYQDTMVRPNLPQRVPAPEMVESEPAGLVGNRTMTAKVDCRGSTYDIYFPTVGMHSDVRPAEGDQSQSRAHFRGIVGGLAVGKRLDWFCERESWSAIQHYVGGTNLLQTELTWRRGPIRVIATDMVVAGNSLPRTRDGVESTGQYIKRYQFFNSGDEKLEATFGVYVQAEVNGGVGDTGLSWQDEVRALLATNRGHGHHNRKLARDSTVEFAIALDENGPVHCETTGPNEAIMLRRIVLEPNGTAEVDVLVSGAFTGWRGDSGTFEYWLRPALKWFRSQNLQVIEQETAAFWLEFADTLPTPSFPNPKYEWVFTRSILNAALHADIKYGSIASGFDRGLNAYCWPRDAVWTAAALDRLGHFEIGQSLFRWLTRAKGRNRPYAYWYQKYTIDGLPEWETPAIDQTAIIPFAIEQHYRRTGDIGIVAAHWPLVEQAATVCVGPSGHPGMKLLEDLNLVSSVNIWDQRFGAFTYSNGSVVAGLQAAARLARVLDKSDLAERWEEMADKIWSAGILAEGSESSGNGLIDRGSGRFLEARRVSKLRSLWTDDPDYLIDESLGTDVSVLGLSVPFGLLNASDPRMRRTVEAILEHNAPPPDTNLLIRNVAAPQNNHPAADAPHRDHSTLATLWMTRYLIQLGRESGQAAHWNRAQAMLEATLARIGPLGLTLTPAIRKENGGKLVSDLGSGVWGLHAMLIETLLDFVGLEYDAVDRKLTISPALPSNWPHLGMARSFPCGAVSYRILKVDGGRSYRLNLLADLKHPIELNITTTCPGLPQLNTWQSSRGCPAPIHDHPSSRIDWKVDLPAGKSDSEWTWS